MVLHIILCIDIADMHVPMINTEDGSVLIGDKAPLARDVNKWLEDHPGWIVARPDTEEEETEV